MNKIKFEHPSGATPLDPNEINGLIPDYISTQGELNTLEKENILEAITWAHSKKIENTLDISFVYELHKKMFNRVWRWAGKPRSSDKSIGIPWEQISTQLPQLLDDVKYWIENHTYPWDELAARFHCRIVGIHIFPNGNGRHGRLITDILLQSNGQKPFTWGSSNTNATLDVEGQLRDQYIAALKNADANNFTSLIQYVRS